MLTFDPERSESLRDTYPDLEEYISTKQQFGCPTCVSLGPDGYYFIRTAWGCSYKIPDDAKAHLGDMTKVEQFFFGANGAWVALKYGGDRSWNTKNQYPGLDVRIKDGPGTITNIRVSVFPGVCGEDDFYADTCLLDACHEPRKA